MNNNNEQRLLVKMKGNAPASALWLDGMRLGMAAAAIPLKTEPLFKSIGKTSGLRVSAADAGAWHLVTAPVAARQVGGWDLCHEFIRSNNSAVFAEPDFEQQWLTSDTVRAPHHMGMRNGGAHMQDIGDGYAGDAGDNYWFRDGRHGQFDAALARVGAPAAGQRVRIAHLDTGFDPHHATVPRYLNSTMQFNCVETDTPRDATDRPSGLFNSFSHGCGTLSLLAGNAVPGAPGFGCAPNAEVIPVRVANGVVLFSNSSVARGFDYVHSLCSNPATRVHVVSMSMGGLPSQAWAEAINALYDAGVVVVAAAGNNYANAPTRLVVYPARFDRVIAACGVMADGEPYGNLPFDRMAGNYGPDEKMKTAIAAYTPNTPWARFGAANMVDFDGNGTSAATPQVAGAAALWIEHNRADYEKYPENWMRVEAVRNALFEAAATGDRQSGEEFGRGLLRANDALDIPCAVAGKLRKTVRDAADYALLNLLFGVADAGLAAGLQSAGVPQMLQLEALQVTSAAGLDDTVHAASPGKRRALAAAFLRNSSLSISLRTRLASAGHTEPTGGRNAIPDAPLITPRMREHFLHSAKHPTPPVPPFRRLKIYAYDPGLQTRPDMFDVSTATVSVPWEDELKPGPIGRYIEVVDVDPASGSCYMPVDLNHPHMLAENGLAPSPANPQFHQQMAYAVAMRAIAKFEQALGRRALWASRVRRDARGNFIDKSYVPRLRIYPHALREANAYYDPEKLALLFGYFRSDQDSPAAPRNTGVFAVTSSDVVAHETAHALLDGLHPRYSERSNIDMTAFHEAFADIVALFLHFSMPESLSKQIRQARGLLDVAQNLGELARQFGEATGMHGALRRFVGKSGKSIPQLSDDVADPHTRGAILVSAVFAAFMTIYRSRAAGLVKLATNGSGVLPPGEISDELAAQLTAVAAKTADQVLNISVRALDYCPPVNLTFGDYLRALITADFDLVPNDDLGYRVAFIDAFRERAIIPPGISYFAEDSLLWEPPAISEAQRGLFSDLIGQLNLRWALNVDRAAAYDISEKNGDTVRKWLAQAQHNEFREDIGFVEAMLNATLPTSSGPLTGEIRPVEVHSVRPLRRVGPDGQSRATLIIELTQTFRADPAGERYRGGCTLLVDLSDNRLKYVVRKRLFGASRNVADAQRLARTIAVEQAAEYGQVYYPPDDPKARATAFAMVHHCGMEL